MKNLKLCVFFLVFIVVSPIFAEFPVFPLSTEMQIGKMRNLVNKAPQGVFLTVGGERAFRGGAMFMKIKHLMIVDRSSEIVRFGKINIELLKAPNKELYKELRWNAPWSVWEKLSDKLTKEDFDWWNTYVRNVQRYSIPEELNRYGSCSYYNKYFKIYDRLMFFYSKIGNKFNKSIKAYLNNIVWQDIESLNLQNDDLQGFREDFEWFDQERKNEKSCVNIFINHPSHVVDLGQVIDYKSGNYLFEDKLYQRLHKLTLANKITVMQIDLEKIEHLHSLREHIQELNLPLSVLDFDNLFAYEYMGEEKFRTAVSQLISLGGRNSILVLMHNYQRYACAQFSIYVGFTFENFMSWPKDIFFYHWIHNLPSEVYPVIDGRLYEKNESLPLSLAAH